MSRRHYIDPLEDDLVQCYVDCHSWFAWPLAFVWVVSQTFMYWQVKQSTSVSLLRWSIEVNRFHLAKPPIKSLDLMLHASWWASITAR